LRVVEKAGAMGIKTTKRMMTIDDLLDADEVFLTNSSWGVLPVVRVEAETIGSGAVGEVTRRIREAVVG
jgi:branched-subunit amino acid aminotransferase/4-amino-4-deoxychorismate lyase